MTDTDTIVDMPVDPLEGHTRAEMAKRCAELRKISPIMQACWDEWEEIIAALL